MMQSASGRPKQQHFRHKPVNMAVLQRTMLALHQASNDQVRSPHRRMSAPHVGTGSMPTNGSSSARSIDQTTDHASTPNNEIDFTLTDDIVIRQILDISSAENLGEVAPPTPNRTRNITDAYIVPYSDEDITSIRALSPR